MEQTMIKVTILGETKEYPSGVSYGEIVKEYEGKLDAPIILVAEGTRLRELHKKADKDCELTLITTKYNIGHKTYKRSACLVMLKAIYDVAGQEAVEKVVAHYSVGSGLYFTVHGSVDLNQEFLDKVKARMREIVDAKMPIMKRSISTDEAIALFHQHRMYDKEKLFRYRRVSKVNIYRIGNFEDYFYGFMAAHAGYVQYFDLKLYDEGFVLQLPNQSDPTVIPEFCPEEKIFQVQKESQEWIEKLDIETVGDLNDRITKGGFRNLMLIQEALQEAKISGIAEKIAAAKDVKFVMVAGPSSSGKNDVFSQTFHSAGCSWNETASDCGG